MRLHLLEPLDRAARARVSFPSPLSSWRVLASLVGWHAAFETATKELGHVDVPIHPIDQVMSKTKEERKAKREDKEEKRARKRAKKASQDQQPAVEDESITCKDCATVFVFSAEEQKEFTARGFGKRVRCMDCTKAKQERYAASNSAQEAPPKYDDATEKRLDAWVAAKRSHAFDAADKLRAALRADGIDTEAARPLGYQPPAAAKSAKKVKCFNCGKVGHRSEECTAVAAGSTACYICGMEGHKGRDCPMAPEKKAFDPKAAKCFQCGQVGHLSAACPQPKAKDACHLCGEVGHVSRYCPRARDKPLPTGWDADTVEAKRTAWEAARAAKDYATADALRAELLAIGVNPNKPRPLTAAQIEARVAEWEAARAAKDFELADKLRASLKAIGALPVPSKST